jgi:predicted AlkP superfamily phosphohydrolase/phosphomutase
MCIIIYIFIFVDDFIIYDIHISKHILYYTFKNYLYIYVYIIIQIFILIDDLRHLTTVRKELHNKYAEENEMSSFMIYLFLNVIHTYTILICLYMYVYIIIQIIILIDDLRHLTAVRKELHNKFAEENEMSSFLMSAKSGDQVKQAFFKIAAVLAGKCTCMSA